MTLRLPEINHVHLVGRLTRDPELRFTSHGMAVCSFSVAVNRRYKDKASGEWKESTTYVPVVVWREAGERCKERLKLGSPVQVEGRLRGREYKDKTGQRRRIIEVEARRVQFLAAATAESPAGEVKPASGGALEGHAEAVSNEDLEDVPF